VVFKWDCKRFKLNNDNEDRISSNLKHNSDCMDINTEQKRPLGRPRQRWDNNRSYRKRVGMCGLNKFGSLFTQYIQMHLVIIDTEP
jgi:hypothetical protein